MQAPLLYGVLSQVTTAAPTPFSYEGVGSVSDITGTFTFDIGSAGNQRMVVIMTGVEGKVVPDGITVDGKAATLLTTAENNDSIGNYSSMWIINESELASSNGVVNIQFTGASLSAVGAHAHLYYGVPNSTPDMYDINDTFIASSAQVEVTLSANSGDLVVLYACNGSTGVYTIITSPLIFRETTVHPTSAIAGSGSALEIADHTDKIYGMQNNYSNRASAIGAVWTVNNPV